MSSVHFVKVLLLIVGTAAKLLVLVHPLSSSILPFPRIEFLILLDLMLVNECFYYLVNLILLNVWLKVVHRVLIH